MSISPASVSSGELAASTAVGSRHLLVATDGSVEADAACRVAVALAARDERRLVILTVLAPPAGAPAPNDAEQRMALTMLERTASSATEALGPERVDTSLRIGVPGASIVAAAAACDADAIILGSAHRGRIQRAVASDTAMYVARHAAMPVVVVPPHGGPLPRRALVAVDFDGDDLSRARAAAALVGGAGMILLAHVARTVTEAPARVGASLPWTQHYEEATRALLGQLAKRVRQEHPSLAVRIAIVGGEPATAIRAVAAREGMGLVVVGRHEHSAPERQLFGSVVETLVRSGERLIAVAPRRSDGQVPPYHS